MKQSADEIERNLQKLSRFLGRKQKQIDKLITKIKNKEL
jgi:hypothetical protein